MSIEVCNLVRLAPGTQQRLLDDVSLTIPKGAFVALVGPSGAGKTTLLRAIAGLDNCNSGSVLLDERPMTSVKDRAGRMGFVFQNYALFPHMTVARNIAFGLDVLPRSERPARAYIAQRVEELLELMQLQGMGGKHPAKLSGGQRQRVALARALATGPRVLLLDEPFGALDPIVRRSIRAWLRDLHDRLGLTTILVTHDQEEALEVADRIVVMQSGRIVQDATPLELDEQPATNFVMEFLGEAVSFAGEVRHGRMVLDDALVLPFIVPDGVTDGPAVAMIRPYEIAIQKPTSEQDVLSIYAAPRGTRNGYRHYTLQIGERIIPFYRPVDEDDVQVQGVALDISRSRLFRQGLLCG
ncbi:sulfate/molybdate ABC transporter ATP-binding protein [Acetobacter syzygii]|uniref:Sulfate ABC transporter ATP-binding protein n=1 Tax=Acetobacter syzygii TaxID=146476 RepID=A0A270BTP8_9PROT|nr:ATP-binding cassette domain-containing protein [Acetobacter syzygii]PAL28385.1 sulfate ABC transporter ATP-binding protein [Acetobacter syzygii]PAL28813.1 sulfate ABC transporter ATP-binding protein [Acetobacter syzygii]GAN71178.1 ABC transporter sulfate permease cysA [Acetobacter syzygii]GBR63620.1 nitrate/sulfonate/bicarbonate transporter ATP-binding protein [Acetobacter syzygii NRIC 0483]GEL55060.1 sulfate/thiosulfate import ATP-binding protein CysA [Acetobacter syzygii]